MLIGGPPTWLGRFGPLRHMSHFASRSPVAVNFGQSVATILAMHAVSAVALRALGLLRFHAEI